MANPIFQLGERGVTLFGWILNLANPPIDRGAF